MRSGSAWLAILCVVLVAAIAERVAAQGAYRWIDDKGVVHYSQSPPPAPAEPPPAPDVKLAPAPEAKPSRPGAPSPAAGRAIRELVHLAAGAGVSDAMFQQVAHVMVPSLKVGLERQLNRPITPTEEQKLVTAIQRSFAGVFPASFFESDMIGIYAKYFCEAEADEMLRFYRTPVGAKAMRLVPTLAGEGAQIGQRLAQSRQAELTQRLREEVAREFSK